MSWLLKKGAPTQTGMDFISYEYSFHYFFTTCITQQCSSVFKVLVASKYLNTACWQEAAGGPMGCVLDPPLSTWEWLGWYSEASLSITSINATWRKGDLNTNPDPAQRLFFST